MKKIFTFFIAAVAAVSLMAQEEENSSSVSFAYDAGAEVVSSYLWRGLYNGGLSFQPDVEVGYDGENTSLRVGVWANVGASDWGFKADKEDGSAYTMFMPEVDVVGSFTFFGASVGFNHYYYCDGSNFFSWQTVDDIIANGSTSTTEVWAGYNFDHLFGVGAYINWYTTVAGNDLVFDDEDNAKRAWSSYLELGYDYTWEESGFTLGGQIGISPWASDLYGNSQFAVTNISVKLNKEWELENATLDLFTQVALNPDGIHQKNVFIGGVGEDKLYNQKLNGCIGLGVWF